MAYVADGMIDLGWGIAYPQYSMEGIAIAEVLLAVANGEDVERATQRIAREIEEFFGAGEIESGSQARGIHIRENPLWPGGTVPYVWGPNMDATFRNETRRAMNRWEDAAQRRVRFVEQTGLGWNGHLTHLAAMRVVRIEKIKSGTSSASVGSTPDQWYGGLQLNLRQNLQVNGSDVTIYTVALHELGHVLGLWHEQQRADRNTFVELTQTDLNDTVNNGIFAETWQTHLVIKWIPSLNSIKVSGDVIAAVRFFVLVLLVQTTHTPQFEKTNSFDFNSIMI
jgi:hypothetical protein